MRNKIRKLRTAKGWSQRHLAEMAQTSQQQVQRVEVGDQTVKLDLAVRLAAALEVSLPEAFPGIAISAAPRSQAKGRSGKDRPSEVSEVARLRAAGIDTETDSRILLLHLRGGRRVWLPVSSEDRDRFLTQIQDFDDTEFFCCDSGQHRVLINLREIRIFQDLWEPAPKASEFGMPKFEALEQGAEPSSFDDEEVSVLLAGTTGIFTVCASPDSDESEGEDIGPFALLVDEAQMGLDPNHFFAWTDCDGERCFVRATDVALMAIPYWVITGELDPSDDELGYERGGA